MSKFSVTPECNVVDSCRSCEVLVGLDGYRITGVIECDGKLVVEIESKTVPAPGCPRCGVVGWSHGRRDHRLVDCPGFGRPVELIWRKHRWRCGEPTCPVGVFTEQDDRIAAPRGLLSNRAIWWAARQIRRENASMSGVARQLGCAWDTVNTAVMGLLASLDVDSSRFDGVKVLGVDEHIWHHVNPARRGPREFTGMVDLTRDEQGNTHARLLDLVPGRSGTVYAAWLDERGNQFKQGVKIAALDPFRGYKNAIDDKLDDARAVLDAFHVVKLGFQALTDVRCRVQQDTCGHRGRKNDPLYRIRRLLVTGWERLSEKQIARLMHALELGDPNDEVFIGWQCVQLLRDAYQAKNLHDGMRKALRIARILPTCPIPEIARIGRTLHQWKQEFLAYWMTGRTTNGGTEAINNLIELARRVARGFTNPHNYRLRMLLIGGAFNHPNLNYPHQNEKSQ